MQAKVHKLAKQRRSKPTWLQNRLGSRPRVWFEERKVGPGLAAGPQHSKHQVGAEAELKS